MEMTFRYFQVWATAVNSLPLLATDISLVRTLEYLLYDTTQRPLFKFIEYGCVAMVATTIPVISLDSLKLTWSHIWFMLGGAVLTLCIGINELRRVCTHLATTITRGRAAEPTTNRGAGTDAGFTSNVESRGGVDTATNNAPAWADLETAVDAQEWHRAIESV